MAKEKMNISAVDFPPNVDELVVAGLTPDPSVQVRTPRIAESPVNLECREIATLELGHTRIVVGEVIHLHVWDDLIDPANLYVHTDRLRAIGRMHGGGWYVRTADLFEIPRLTHEEWQARTGNG